MLKETEKIKAFIEKQGKSLFVFMGLLGILLIFLSDRKPTETINKTDTDRQSYIHILEKDLCSILSSVKNAGKVEVMITLESGRETVYAWQEKTSRDEKSTANDTNNRISKQNTYENEIVTVGSGSTKEALIEKTLEPVVQGVIVVCSGGDDIKVVSDITNAVSVVLNIPTNRICVIKMQ